MSWLKSGPSRLGHVFGEPGKSQPGSTRLGLVGCSSTLKRKRKKPKNSKNNRKINFFKKIIKNKNG